MLLINYFPCCVAQLVYSTLNGMLTLEQFTNRLIHSAAVGEELNKNRAFKLRQKIWDTKSDQTSREVLEVGNIDQTKCYWKHMEINVYRGVKLVNGRKYI